MDARGLLFNGVFTSDNWYPGDDVVDMVGFTAYVFWGWEEWMRNAPRAMPSAARRS